jgi:hypothetical protein
VASGFPLRFHAEIVRLFIEPESLRVEGNYWFACSRPDAGLVPLFYPYPSDSLLGEARTLRFEGRPAPRARAVDPAGQPAEDAPWTPLRFSEVGGSRGVRWLVPAGLGDTVEVRTTYRQALKAAYARYIVTTTKAWPEPLAWARFEIHLPEGARPVRFSFPFQKAVSLAGEHYVYQARNFLPREDIVVEWRTEASVPPR